MALALQAVVGRWAGVERLVNNNEIAGIKLSVIGAIYAVATLQGR